MSYIFKTGVFPSLNVKSVNSSSPFFAAPPLILTTPFSSTLAFFPDSETASFAISGKDSPLAPFDKDF